MTKARALMANRVESASLLPAEEMDSVEEVTLELVDEMVASDEEGGPEDDFLTRQVLGDVSEDADGMNLLRQMAQDMEELRGLTQTMASLRHACSEAGDRRGPPGADVGWQATLSSWFDDDAKSQLPASNEQVDDLGIGNEDDDEGESDWKDVMVELRIQSLLETPFHTALQACPALRRYIDDQADLELEKEFEEHWHSNACEELRHVLRELLLVEVSDGENESIGGTSGSSTPQILRAPPRSRL
jgi:hypothetical protein